MSSTPKVMLDNSNSLTVLPLEQLLSAKKAIEVKQEKALPTPKSAVNTRVFLTQIVNL